MTAANVITLGRLWISLAIFVVLVLLGPWMLTTMLDYIQNLFTGIPGMIG